MKVMHKIFGGHLTLGRVTIYGLNAMNWAVNISTKKYGTICFRLPLPCFGRFPSLYFYISPNGTPWAATYFIGGGSEYEKDRILAPVRRYRLGLYFDFWHDEHKRNVLKEINNII